MIDTPPTSNTERLEQLREQIREIDIQIDAIETGRLTVDDAYDRLRSRINRDLEWMRTRLGYFAAPVPLPELSLAEASAAIAILADPEGFERRARAALERLVPTDAIPLADRQATIAPLAEKRRELLVAEEAEIVRLERAGVPVERRRDVAPEVLLAAWEVDDEATTARRRR